MHLKKLSKENNIFVLYLVMFFTIVNLKNIFLRDLFVDEVITFNIVNHLSFLDILKGIDVHPPLYYIVMKILPHTLIYFLRFYSLIFFLIAIVILFIDVKKFYSEGTSFLLIVIVLLSTTISEYSTQARMYSLLFLLSTLMLSMMLRKKYYYALGILILSLYTHYYGIFLCIPLFLTYLKDKKFKVIIIGILILFVSLLILAPYVYHQFNYNDYKINPPQNKVSMISFPSMILFPFIIPSDFDGNTFMIICSYLLFFLLLYLIYCFKKEDMFVILGFSVPIIIFITLFILKLPYHHRYTIIAFPFVYLYYADTIMRRKEIVSWCILICLVLFLFSSFLSYQRYIPYQLQQMDIECPANILHETPFSFLPMSIYYPKCLHYFGNEGDWDIINHVTLYTTSDRINNYNVSYNYYIHYFNKYKLENMLNNSFNITPIKIR